jgi:hypothetical protein
VRRFLGLLAVLAVLAFGCGIAIGGSQTSSAPKSSPAPLSVFEQEHLIANCIEGDDPAACRKVGMPTDTGPPPTTSPGANAGLRVGPAS